MTPTTPTEPIAFTERCLPLAKLVMFASISFLCVAVGITWILTGASTRRVEEQTVSSEYMLGLTGQQTLKTMSDNTTTIAKRANQVLYAAGLAAAEATKVSITQGNYMKTEVPELGKRVQKTLDNVNTLTTSLTKVSNTTNDTVAAAKPLLVQLTADAAPIKPLIEHSTTAIDSLNLTIQSANGVVSNPAIPRLFAAGVDITDHTDHLMINLDGISDDAKDKFHQITHPTKWGKFEGGLMLGLDVAEKLALTRGAL